AGLRRIPRGRRPIATRTPPRRLPSGPSVKPSNLSEGGSDLIGGSEPRDKRRRGFGSHRGECWRRPKGEFGPPASSVRGSRISVSIYRFWQAASICSQIPVSQNVFFK